MSLFFEVLITAVLTILGIAIVAMLLIGALSLIERAYCGEQQSIMTNQDFEWRFWSGCMIKAPDNTWVNAGDYLSVERLRLQLEE